jgi:hypothetical protein
VPDVESAGGNSRTGVGDALTHAAASTPNEIAPSARLTMTCDPAARANEALDAPFCFDSRAGSRSRRLRCMR